MFPDHTTPSFWDSLRVDECTIVASLWSNPWGLQGVRVPFPLEEIWDHVHAPSRLARSRFAGAAAARGSRGRQPPPPAVTDHSLDDDVKLQFFPVRGYGTYTWGLTVIPRSAALMGNMVVSTGQDTTLRLFEFPAIGVTGAVKQVACLTRKDPGSGTHVWRGGKKTHHKNVSSTVTFCNAAYVETRETLFTCGREPEEVVTWDLHKLVQKDAVTYQQSHQAFGICKVEEGASHLPPGCFVGDTGGFIRFWSLKEGLAANCTSRGGAAVMFQSKPRGNFYSVLFHPESHLIYAAGYSVNSICIYDVRMTPSSAKDNVIAELHTRSSIKTKGSPSNVIAELRAPRKSKNTKHRPSNLAFLGRNKEFIVAATGRTVMTWKAGKTSKACVSKVSHSTRGLRSRSETQYDPHGQHGDVKGVAEDELERVGYLFQVLGDDEGGLFERTRIEDSGGSVSFLAFSSLML